ncbi:hypothetical protein Tco_0121217 [Tanacetum coccineum]
MGCAKTIEEMLEIKVIEMGGNEKVFSFEAWRRAFDIRESIIPNYVYEFFFYIEFDKEMTVYDEDCEEVQLLADDVLDGLRAPILCRSLDATTLKELISHDSRLIIEDQAPGVLRFAIPRPSRPTLQDLSDRMGRMEIRQGVLERTSYRQLYHSDRYAGVFEYMAGHYEVQLAGDYAPQDYDEQ